MALTSWLQTIFALMPFGRYWTNGPTTPQDGEAVELQVDSAGRLKVAIAAQTAPPTQLPTLWKKKPMAGKASSDTVKASAGTLYTIYGSNESASKRYLHIFDSATVPPAATPPAIAPIPVPAGQTFSLDLERGIPFVAGITWAVSSTADTYTPVGGAEFWVTAEYL